MHFVEKGWKLQRKIERKVKRLWKWNPKLCFALARWPFVLLVSLWSIHNVNLNSIMSIVIWINYLLIFHIIGLSFEYDDFNKLSEHVGKKQ